MQGEQFLEITGQVTMQRVLESEPGGAMVMETTVTDAGTAYGTAANLVTTFTGTVRPDGTILGDGNGVLTTADGAMATFKAGGVGTISEDGGVSWAGAGYFYSSDEALARLNRVAAVFEYALDAQGNTSGTFWEWK
jgi:hypothetical protein